MRLVFLRNRWANGVIRRYAQGEMEYAPGMRKGAKRMNELLTADEVAERLRVKAGTVRTWGRMGRIPTVRLTAKVVRFDLGEVVAALTARPNQDRESARGQ